MKKLLRLLALALALTLTLSGTALATSDDISRVQALLDALLAMQTATGASQEEAADQTQALLDALAANPNMTQDELNALLAALMSGGALPGGAPTPEPTPEPTPVPVDPAQALADALAANPNMTQDELNALLAAILAGQGAVPAEPSAPAATPVPTPEPTPTEAPTPVPTPEPTPVPVDPAQALADALAANPNMSAEELQALLDAITAQAAGGQTPTAAPMEFPLADPTEAPTEVPEITPEPVPAGPTEVPQAAYTLMDGYAVATLNDTIAVQVPAAWGNNASGRAFTSYSPANRSGAIDPASGTLSTSWFPNDEASGEAALTGYEDGIRKMNIAANVSAEEDIAAGQQARRISYDMTVGANKYSCQAVCFTYGDTVYAVELTQGVRSTEDFFPVFDAVVGSLAVMNGDWQPVPAANPSEPTPVPQPAPAVPTPVPQPAPAVPAANLPADLGAFAFSVNGHVYNFPTVAALLTPGDLPIDMAQVLPYDLNPAAEANGGIVNELINTQCIYFDNTQFKELAGLTNLTGAPTAAASGMLTALVDTQAPNISLQLPGGIAVGQSEALIPGAFPEFAGRAMDGLAGFRGNELLYACNVRDDGCNGYVIIRNDAPFYSTLSIICENGVIREINFECLGNTRAYGIFE